MKAPPKSAKKHSINDAPCTKRSSQQLPKKRPTLAFFMVQATFNQPLALFAFLD
jgi:hypothetical protein